MCTTDDDMRQIASFYAGAMAGAREIDLGPSRSWRPGPGADRRRTTPRRCCGTPTSAVSAGSRSPRTRRSSSPAWRARRSARCRRRRLPVQQRLRVGAAAAEDRLDRGRGRAARRHPGDHARREGRRDRRPGRHRPQGRRGARDPAGRPDRGRRRLPGGLPRRRRPWGLTLERAAQLGALIAALVLETDGTQDWTLDRDSALERSPTPTARTPRRRSPPSYPPDRLPGPAPSPRRVGSARSPSPR